MKGKYFYIKERFNPQFDKTAYYALGNISKADAQNHFYSLYGYNNILRFSTKKEYVEKCKELGIEIK